MTGEATITLEDVALIWQLPVAGAPITGVDERWAISVWQEYCLEYLGFAPSTDVFSGATIPLSVLLREVRYRTLTVDSTEDDVARYTRCYVLLLLGCRIFPDSSGDRVKLLYLRMLEDVSRTQPYSWGSAALAYLYRELCSACMRGRQTIAGPLELLQIWTWIRIPGLGPQTRDHGLYTGTITVLGDVQLPAVPFGARYVS